MLRTGTMDLYLMYFLNASDYNSSHCFLNPNYVHVVEEIQATRRMTTSGQAVHCQVYPHSCLCPSRYGSPPNQNSVYKFSPVPMTDQSERLGLSVASPVPLASPVSSQGPICRICHEGDVKEDLFSPCRCSGTMALVHRTCIEKWLSSSNLDACEICKYVFITYKKPRPYIEWLKDPSTPSDLRHLAGDLLCFVLLTPLAAVSVYLCTMGARHYALWSTRWEASGLVCLAVFLVTIYLAWCGITIRYHLNVMSEWRRTHPRVKLMQMRRIPTEPSLTSTSTTHSAPARSTDSNNNSSANETTAFPSRSCGSGVALPATFGVSPMASATQRDSSDCDTPPPYFATTVTIHTILQSSKIPETVV